MGFVWNMRRRAVWLVLLLACANAAHSETHAVVVSGLGGEKNYSDSFSAAAQSYATALQTLDNGEERIVLLDETAGRDQILTAIQERVEAANSSPSATLVLILVGHGTTDGSTWRFNITGPDLTTEDIVAALNPMSSGRQLVVLAASASGATLEALTQSQRVVVTATKSGGELNAVRFPEYLAAAMETSEADYDRNEILTMAEAFRYANARTQTFYEQQKLLASEHSRLVGDLAADIPVALLGSLKEAQDDPVVASLLAERLLLEEAFKALKARKQDLPTVDYYAQLEVLLLDIARMQQSIDAVTGWSETDAES
ncbi:C13 family peptidase [Granulosicoccus antarcticus]|uniref:Uncharacterized protein n=1 Tax=Granulosicoccus antarcticus IMCC3135 TaxID=1192854 RepID=A0A2Z2P2G7_9GAMM|nr:C13 family peptidase [Granulosicoccus antarcticus]ASJ74747.1 hypothetical protein IMCC3135_23390 [Granulosicoccus antarcticus IMCC3135]